MPWLIFNATKTADGKIRVGKLAFPDVYPSIQSAQDRVYIASKHYMVRMTDFILRWTRHGPTASELGIRQLYPRVFRYRKSLPVNLYENKEGNQTPQQVHK